MAHAGSSSCLRHHWWHRRLLLVLALGTAANFAACGSSASADTSPITRLQQHLQAGAAYLQGLDGNIFHIEGTAEHTYALLVQHEDGVAVIGRFSRAYTTGVAFINNTITPYKPKGTWIKSLAIQIKESYSSKGDQYSTFLSSSVLLVASSSTAYPSSDSKLRYGSLQTVYLPSSTGNENPAPLLSVKVFDDVRGNGNTSDISAWSTRLLVVCLYDVLNVCVARRRRMQI